MVQVQLTHNFDAVFNRSSNRATLSVNSDYTVYGLAVLLVRDKVESLLDPLDHQHLVLGLYLPHRLGVEVLEGNLTRCQRASKGPEQSPSGRGD